LGGTPARRPAPPRAGRPAVRPVIRPATGGRPAGAPRPSVLAGTVRTRHGRRGRALSGAVPGRRPVRLRERCLCGHRSRVPPWSLVGLGLRATACGWGGHAGPPRRGGGAGRRLSPPL